MAPGKDSKKKGEYSFDYILSRQALHCKSGSQPSTDLADTVHQEYGHLNIQDTKEETVGLNG